MRKDEKRCINVDTYGAFANARGTLAMLLSSK